MGGDGAGGNRLSAPSTKRSARDLPAHLSLKYRKRGQGSVADMRELDLKAELERKEREARQRVLDGGGAAAALEKERMKREEAEAAERQAAKDAAMKALRDMAAAENPYPEDADRTGQKARGGSADAADEKSDKGSKSGSDSDSDEDDMEELMRELAKIKKERAEEEERKRQQEAERIRELEREQAIENNPLSGFVPGESDLSLRRPWDEDTPFRNQARTTPKQAPQFINDVVRSSFHRRFLRKYIR